MTTYRIELTKDDNGTLLVTCPALPEVTTFADDEAEAYVHACEAIEEALAARISGGVALPASDAKDGDGVSLRLLTELKCALYTACKRQNVTRAELSRRLGWKRESVDRLFRLDHASLVSQMEAALRAVGLQTRVAIVAVNEGPRLGA